jgi:hypothetical protein
MVFLNFEQNVHCGPYFFHIIKYWVPPIFIIFLKINFSSKLLFFLFFNSLVRERREKVTGF